MSSPSADDMDRADSIIMWSVNTGRNPFDTAGMDTSDEEWMDENLEWHDYIQDQIMFINRQKKAKDEAKAKAEAERNILSKNLQNLAFATGIIPHSNYNTPLRYLDYDTLGKIMSRSRPYNHDVQNRMMENDRIADYLNTIEQYGMGKRSKGKHGKKFAKRTQKNRRKKNRF